MTWLAGVDGCRKGWFRVCRDSDSQEIRFDVLETAEELVSTLPCPIVVAIDMPIGLPEAGARECDVAARQLLGPRRSSVFRAPIRPSLTATSRLEADSITRSVEGKGVSAQAWGIYGKVKSVDCALANDAKLRSAFCEVHPEVSFLAWNDRQPMAFSKKKREGRRERAVLAEAWLGEGILARARGGELRKHLADDDILDAIAALWTAHRIASGAAETLPESPPRDRAGLPMRIVF